MVLFLIFWPLVYDLWIFKVYEIYWITPIAAYDLIEQKIMTAILFQIFLFGLLQSTTKNSPKKLPYRKNPFDF